MISWDTRSAPGLSPSARSGPLARSGSYREVMSIATPDRDPRSNEDEGHGVPEEERYAQQERSDVLPAEELPGGVDPERDNPEDPGDLPPQPLP